MFFIKTFTVCQRLGCDKYGLERRGKHKKCGGKGCDSTRMQTARRFSPARFAMLAVSVSLFIFIQQNNGWPLVLQRAVGFTASVVSEVRRLLLPDDSNAARKDVHYPSPDTMPAVAYTPRPTPVPFRDPANVIVSAVPRSGDIVQQSDPQWIMVSLPEDAAVITSTTAPAEYDPVTGWAVAEKRPLLPNRLAIGDVLVAGTVCYDEGQTGEMTIVFNASSNPVPVHAPWGAGEVALPEDQDAAWLTIDSIINDALTIRPDIFRVRLVTICPCGVIKTSYFQ